MTLYIGEGFSSLDHPPPPTTSFRHTLNLLMCPNYDHCARKSLTLERVRFAGVSRRHGNGGRGERHDGGVDVHPLARTPPAQLAVHGRRAVRDAVPGAAAQLVPVRVRGGQRGHALLALALGLPARRRGVRLVRGARAEGARRAQGHVRRGRARAHRHRLAPRAGHPQVSRPLPRFGQQQAGDAADQRPRPVQDVRRRFPHAPGPVQRHPGKHTHYTNKYYTNMIFLHFKKKITFYPLPRLFYLEQYIP